MAKPTADAAAAAPAAPTKKPAPAKLLVLDTTATADQPKRIHEMTVNGRVVPFIFEHGKPLALDPAVAFKFLKHEPFWLVNENGDRQDYRRRPKQPDELEAGETLVLADNETVARYEELSTPALMQRVLELPGSDKFAVGNPARSEVIRFIVDIKAKTKKENTRPDTARDEFVPEAELGDEGDEAEAA